SLRGGGGEVERLAARIGGSNLELSGEMTGSEIEGLQVKGRVDLRDIRPLISQFVDLKGLGGELRFEISASGPLKGLKGEAKLISKRVAVGDGEINNLRVESEIDGRRIEADFEARLAGGRLRGRAEIDLAAERRIKCGASFEGLGLPALVKLAGLKPPDLTGRISGEVDFETQNGSHLLAGEVRGEGVTFNGAPMTPLRLSCSIENESLRATGVLAGIDLEAGGRIDEVIEMKLGPGRIGPLARAIGLGMVDGSGEVNLRIKGDRIEVWGKTCDTTFAGLPAGEVDFNVAGPISELRIERLEARYNGMRFSMKGRIAELSEGDLDLHFENVPLGDYVRNALGVEGVSGSARGRGWLRGKLSAPDGLIEVELSGLSAYGLRFRPAEFEVELRSGEIAARGMRFELGSGAIEAELKATPPGRVEISGRGDLGIAELLEGIAGRTIPIEGRIEIDFNGSESSVDLTARLKGISMKGKPIGSGIARARITSEGLELELEGFKGAVSTTASLRFERGYPFEAKLELSDFDLTPLLVAGLSGRASLSAELSGSVVDPSELSGRVRLRSLLLSAEGGHLSLAEPIIMQVERGELRVDRLAMIQDGGGRLVISGVLGRGLDLRIAARRFQAGMIDERIESLVDLDARLEGSFGSPRISLNLRSPSAKVKRLNLPPLEDLDLSAELSGGAIDIKRLRFDLAGEPGIITGAISLPPDGRIDLAFSVGLDLGQLNGLIPGVSSISGKARAEGEVKGDLESPRLTAELSLSNCSLASPSLPYPLSSLSGAALLSAERSWVGVDLDKISFEAGGGGFELSGAVELTLNPLTPARYEIRLKGRSADLGSIVKQLLDRPELPAAIRADLSAELEGKGLSLKGISGRVAFKPDVDLAGDRLSGGEAILTLRNGSIALRGFKLLRGEVEAVSIEGSLDLTTGLYSLAAAVDVPARYISALLPTGELGGEVEVDLEGSGELSAPSLKARFRVEKLRSGDVKFEPTISGEASVSGEGLILRGRRAAWGEGGKDNEVLISGSLPIALSLTPRPAFRQIDGDLSLRVEGDLNDLSFASTLLAGLIDLRGKSSFGFTLTGGISSPRIEGGLTAEADKIVLSSIAEPVTDLRVSISAGEELKGEAAFKLGSGDVTLEGSLALVEGKPGEAELSVEFNGLKLEQLRSVKLGSIGPLSGLISGSAWIRSDLKGSFSKALDRLLREGKGELRLRELEIGIGRGRMAASKEVLGVLSDGVFDLRSFVMSGEMFPRLAAMMIWEVGRSIRID
ncbi:hypothetical protein DRP77_09510, partial [Candidatus Poribacteria bacterium]